MKGFTDIHSHIIPGVDDGAGDVPESVEMLRMAYEDGVRRIIATPHFGIRNLGYDVELARESLSGLQEYIVSEDGGCPEMELFMGNEVYFDSGAMSGLADGYALPLAGSSYVLAEFPFVTDFEEIFHGIRMLMVEGYIPIIAHAERYCRYIKKVKDLEFLVEQGAMVQINGSSVIEASECGAFSRKFGSDEGAWTWRALNAGLVHFIGSDCHDLENRRPGLSEAFEALKRIVGEDKAEQIMFDNPDWIIPER